MVQNEAGKTTLMHFVRSMLYGYSAERRDRYLPPVHGGQPGGWLEMELAAGSTKLLRYANGENVRGDLTAQGPKGELPAGPMLRSILADIDEASFNNIYAVGLREIQELGTLSDTDAARWLYSLTTGLDRVSLLDVVQELEASRESLLSNKGKPSQVTELIERRGQLQDEIDQLVANGRKWSQTTVKLQELDIRITALEEERDALERRARTIEIGINTKPKWLQRIDLDRQLEAFDGNTRLPDDAIERLKTLNEEIEEHQRQKEVLRRQRMELKAEVDALGINEILVRNASRIDGLGEQRDWLDSLQRQQEALNAELAEIQSQLTSEHDQLGFNLKAVNVDGKKAPVISEGLISSLRPHAKAVRSAKERLETAQLDAESKHSAAYEYTARLQSSMPDSLDSSFALPTDLQEAGALVANLRKRLQTEQRLEQAKRHEIELVQQNHDLLDRQESPLWMVPIYYVMLFTGLMAGIYGLLTSNSPAIYVGTGTLLVFFLIHIFRYMDEDQNSQRREAVYRQLDLARRQIDSAEKERAELDRTIGPISGSVVVRLQTAERHLTELEKLLPVESRKRDAQIEADSAGRRLTEAERKLETAESSWKSKLQGLGLPTDLTPSAMRDLAERYEQVSGLRLQAENRRGDVEQRKREYELLCRRIHSLAEEVHLVQERANPLDQLDYLQSELRKQWLRVEESDRIRAKAKELKEKEAKHARAAISTQQRRNTVFVQAGAEDGTGYRHLFHEQKRADKIRKERSTVCREIAAAIGSQIPEEEITKLLAPETVGMLDRLWDETTQKLDVTEEALKEVVSRHGAMQLELKQLAEDRSLAEKQLDLSVVEEKLKRACKAWRSHAAFNIVLDEVRTRYERERQPETLKEASIYMERLTEGGYKRIWTPLGKELLFVDNEKGESLPVEYLSRGTREQMFLSLRLALVSLLARRSVRLPMVLDDVLVNFDEIRARQAVRVLADFAKEGHQVLVFTCHENVWKMFRDQGLDARRLPTREGAKISPEVVEPEPVAPAPKKKKRRRVLVAAAPVALHSNLLEEDWVHLGPKSDSPLPIASYRESMPVRDMGNDLSEQYQHPFEETYELDEEEEDERIDVQRDIPLHSLDSYSEIVVDDVVANEISTNGYAKSTITESESSNSTPEENTLLTEAIEPIETPEIAQGIKTVDPLLDTLPEDPPSRQDDQEQDEYGDYEETDEESTEELAEYEEIIDQEEPGDHDEEDELSEYEEEDTEDEETANGEEAFEYEYEYEYEEVDEDDAGEYETEEDGDDESAAA